MAHVGLFFASLREENSRTRSPVRNFLVRTGKRPALANVRASNFLCKRIFGQVHRISARKASAFAEKESSDRGAV
jgi:hypothetical protein